MPSVMDEIISQADLTEERERAERIADNRQKTADAVATECLARVNCPADLRDWGERHGIPEFAKVTWEAGFAAGWRSFFMMQGLTAPPPRDMNIITDAKKDSR